MVRLLSLNVPDIPVISEVKSPWKQREKLIVQRVVLCRKIVESGQDQYQAVLPVSLQASVLKALHNDVDHHGKDQTIKLLRY